MKAGFRLRICLVLVLLTSAVVTTYGQFALGVRVGYNANKLTTNIDSIKSDFNHGFNVGVWAHIGHRFYFAPEVRYTLSGGVFTNEGTVNTTDWKQRITVGSLDVLALAGFKIIHSEGITWRVELGPMASFTVNKKVEELKTVTGPVHPSDINTANWFLIAGTGIDFLFLNFDIRYQYALNPIINQVQSGSQTIDFNTGNNVIVVSVGAKIFGKK